MASPGDPPTLIDVELVASAAAEWGVWKEAASQGKRPLTPDMVSEMQARYGVLKPQLLVAQALLVKSLPAILPQARMSEFLAAILMERHLQRDVAWVSTAPRPGSAHSH